MNRLFSLFSSWISRRAGHPTVFMVSIVLVAVWGVTGPLFHYSDTWQLVINTGTTIVTFLMVFVIQNTQNRDGSAIQAKLDELIRTSAAQNAFIGIEQLTGEEIEEYRNSCVAAANKAVERAKKRASEKARAATQKVDRN
jgi:low affinity Fe/Cu permease